MSYLKNRKQDYLAFVKGPIGKTLARVERSLNSKRNGVVTWAEFAPVEKGYEVHTRNTKANGTHVSRKFYIGRRGGLFIECKNYRRYFKAARLGKGSL
jgi:hypothetical protein